MALIGEKNTEYGVGNPHPHYGKDPNIINEFGHTEYPKYVHKFDDKGAIIKNVEVGEKSDDKGRVFKTVINTNFSSRLVNNEDEEAEAEKDGFAAIWVKPKVKKDEVKKPEGWGDKK